MTTGLVVRYSPPHSHQDSPPPSPPSAYVASSPRIDETSSGATWNSYTTPVDEETSLSHFEDDEEKNQKAKRKCRLFTEKAITALAAITAYNFAQIKPELSPLTWGGILLGNAIAFPPDKLTARKAATVFATVLLGGGGAFLSGYFLNPTQPLAEKFVTSLIYVTSINLLWYQALKDLEASYRGPQRAFISSLTAVSTYKLAHAYIDQPWADFAGSSGVILGNMIAFPPPRANCNRLLKLFLSIAPNIAVALFNGNSENEKYKNAATFIGNTLSLSITWYYGYKGLKEQREATELTKHFVQTDLDE